MINMGTNVLMAGRVALRRIPYWFAQKDAKFFGIL
jgi:hypothetical protein